MSPNAQAPAQQNPAVAALPFPVASRRMTRQSFSTGQVTLGSSQTQYNPIPLPAVGYINKIELEVTINATGGTAFSADGPFDMLASVEFRTANGNDIITPISGYMLYLYNKYMHPTLAAPQADPKNNPQFVQTSGTYAHFFLDIPFEIDAETGLGSIPALASNRSYQLVLIFAPYNKITGATAANIQVDGIAHYWSEPPQQSAGNVAQATQPEGLGLINQVQLETPPITPGNKLIKLNNVGNIMRGLIFVLRNAAGVRVSADWPSITRVYLDNETMQYLPFNSWRRAMSGWYDLRSTVADGANGFDTGVFALPFHAFSGSRAGDPANTRSQYLPTLDASQLQIEGNFGLNASTLEIISNSVVPVKSSDIFNK